MHRLVYAVGLPLLVLACAPTSEERVGHADQEIVNGSADATTDAVVAYIKGSKCSATIVHRDGSTGYALTAAHCIGGQLGQLRQGDNHANGQFDVSYAVAETAVHPYYADSPLFDFAMLRFTGANGSTPVILPMKPAEDQLAKGKLIDLVGYGQTESGNNTLRNHLELPIQSVSELRLNFEQSGGGVCFGDSGGGGIVDVSAGTRVASVHSGVSDDSCLGSSTSVRVSAVYDTFIMPFINETPFLEQTCDQCNEGTFGGGECASVLQACFDSPQCDAYVDCLSACFTGTCQKACQLDHVAGAAAYDAINECGCGECSSECEGDSRCDPEPACGLAFNDDGCGSCVEGSCCAAATACDGDLKCWECMSKGGPVVGCDGSPAYVALQECMSNNCSEPCNVAPPEPTGSGGSGGAGSSVAASTSVGVGGGGGTSSTEPESDEPDDIVVVSSCAASPAVPRTTLLGLLLFALPFTRRRRRAASV